MFKNVIFYRFNHNEWKMSAQQVEAALEKARFHPCGATQPKSIGWVEPRGQDHGPLVEVVQGQMILKFFTETKKVPGSAIKDEVEKRVKKIEHETGRKPGRKEIKDLKEEVVLSLLPKAFTSKASTFVWLDRENGYLIVDASSQSKCDDIITSMVNQLNLSVSLIQTETSPQAAMSEWLLSSDYPGNFDGDRSCDLQAIDESKSTVKYARHDLAIEEIRDHIKKGLLPVKLTMSWNSKITFALTYAMQLKKIELADVDVDEKPADGQEDRFDTDVAIMTGELSQLLPELLEALGGEMEVQ